MARSIVTYFIGVQPNSAWRNANHRSDSPAVVTTLWDALLLVDAERRASTYTDAEHDLVRAKARAATERVKAARDLTAPSQARVVAELLYQAVELRLEAAAIHRDAADVEKLRRAALRELPARAELDALDQETLDEVIASLRAAERRLRAEAEPRTLTNIRATRYGRVGAVIALAAYFIASAIVRATAPPNIALHRAVSVSGGAGDPRELVDGVRETMKPVHLTGSPPTVDIDLAGVYAIDSVRITNREDAHLDSAIPVTVLLSEHEGEWQEIEIHRIHFRTLTVHCGKRHARRVRVRVGTHDTALNEIEVFGRFVSR
jgi:hypothetical protein